MLIISYYIRYLSQIALSDVYRHHTKIVFINICAVELFVSILNSCKAEFANTISSDNEKNMCRPNYVNRHQILIVDPQSI